VTEGGVRIANLESLCSPQTSEKGGGHQAATQCDLLVTPKGGRCWRYAYRFEHRQRTLSLGIYPDVPLTGLGPATSLLATFSPMESGIDPAG
jgi:hypothetical protein